MKKILLIIVLFTLYKTIINGQETEPHRLDISLSTGLVKQTFIDQHINYFIYESKNFAPISLKGNYYDKKNRNLFSFSFFYNYAKLKPDLNNPYYEYNYIKQWTTEFDIECYHKIFQLNKLLRTYIGIANNSYLFLQQELYKSLLYEYIDGYKKSYDLSYINISPNLLFDFCLNKSNLTVKAGYTLISYASRPDDNFIKQAERDHKFLYKLYLPKDYKRASFSLIYQYWFTNKTGVLFEYDVQYISYKSSVKYKFLKNDYLIGLSKSF
jgi:hypothetical protein